VVKFTFLPMDESKITPAQRAQFINLGQLIKWELGDSTGSYSGLIIIGEKAIPQGFQSMADITIDLDDREITSAKIQELSRIVQTEFVQRGVINLRKPGNA
jgi:hypothetical protein